MTTTTFTERVGLGERMYEHLEQNEKELTALGLNVQYWKAVIRASIDAVKSADERQEALKAELKASTVSVNASDRESYTIVSGAIDAVVAAWGKRSENGQILARMRSKPHRPNAPADVLPGGTPPWQNQTDPRGPCPRA